MLEFHGWITIRETYEVRDDEEGLDNILQNIRDRIQNLRWNKPDLKFRNGECYIEISLYANRKTEETIELFDFFTYIAYLATGSYGMIYMLDDEDKNGKNNEFQVFSISRGKLYEHKDTFLSPFIPIVEANMYSWKITKYNPLFNGNGCRDENDEWTSVSDIGKIFKGRMLSLESYKLYENAYIESIHLVMKANNVTSLKVQALEKRYTHDYPDMQEKYSKSYIESLKEEAIICYADIDFLVRLILREMVWCKLIVKDSMFVHFGYDYYMYIGSKKKLVNEIEEMIRLGLFPVEMQSPYLNAE